MIVQFRYFTGSLPAGQPINVAAQQPDGEISQCGIVSTNCRMVIILMLRCSVTPSGTM
jgi:hypothetical protein